MFHYFLDDERKMVRRSTLLPLKKEKYISTKWTRTHFHPRSKRYRSRKFSTASSFFPGGILTSNRAYGSRSTSSLPGFLRRRRNQRAYLRYINGTRSSSDVRGANKEERVLSAINRHQPAIIIDTRCPHNESIYTDVYRYTILSPVRLSRDYAAANLPSPPASSFFLLPLASIRSRFLSLFLPPSSSRQKDYLRSATFSNCFVGKYLSNERGYR